MQDALISIACKSVSDVNICIFVDALDEHDGNHRDLLTTLDRLARLTDNRFFRLRLCLAGRQENIFKDAFRDCPGFSIHELTTGDIHRYTEGRLQNAISGNLTRAGKSALSSLIEDIINKAEGVFLWVRLVNDELIEGLCEGDSIEELRNLLSGIPTELGELYTRTLRRHNRLPTRAQANLKYERYVMFQIVKCCREPFSVYLLLSATLFLTTGRDTYPELQRLSEDQMERRLYSRSAGLLDAPGHCKDGDYLRSPLVQFIHQTVKEYMTAGEGSTIILQDIGNEPQESGFVFILRYLVYLLTTFGESDQDISTAEFAAEYFKYYAQQVERHGTKTANEILGPAISRLSKSQHCVMLERFVDRMDRPSFSQTLCYMSNQTEAQFLALYTELELHKSFSESLRMHSNEITQEDRAELLNHAIFLLQLERVDPLPVSSILEDLLQVYAGTYALRYIFEQFDESIQDLISEGYIEPPARRERVSTLWGQIRERIRDKNNNLMGI